MFWYLGTLLILGGLPLPGLANSESLKTPCWAHPSYAKQSVQVLHPSHLLYQLSDSEPLSTCPHHPRARYQKTWDSCYAPEPTEIIQTCHPKPAHPAWPILCTEITITAFAHVCLDLFASWMTWCFPMWPFLGLLYPGILSINTLPSWQSFPCLYVLPYLMETHLRCMLKQVVSMVVQGNTGDLFVGIVPDLDCGGECVMHFYRT